MSQAPYSALYMHYLIESSLLLYGFVVPHFPDEETEAQLSLRGEMMGLRFTYPAAWPACSAWAFNQCTTLPLTGLSSSLGSAPHSWAPLGKALLLLGSSVAQSIKRIVQPAGGQHCLWPSQQPSPFLPCHGASTRSKRQPEQLQEMTPA